MELKCKDTKKDGLLSLLVNLLGMALLWWNEEKGKDHYSRCLCVWLRGSPKSMYKADPNFFSR